MGVQEAFFTFLHVQQPSFLKKTMQMIHVRSLNHSVQGNVLEKTKSIWYGL